jgi:LysM repeat protein
MIEFVYKEDAKEKGMERRLELPKNVRQMGEPEDSRKIYMEDYVVTYLKRYANEEQQNRRGAVLLGHSEWMEGIPYLFVESAVAMKELAFGDEMWSELYETMKEYFPEQDILGWFLSVPAYSGEPDEDLVRKHVSYFGGVDKVLMTEDPLDGDEEFYAYENGRLVRQKGYYIYYERNEAMQRYMVDTGDGESIDEKENFDDRAIRSFRTIVQEKKELSGQKRVMTFLYAASTFLVMVVLVIGITLINNYEKMEGLELTLSEISRSLEMQGGQPVSSYAVQAEIPEEAAQSEADLAGGEPQDDVQEEPEQDLEQQETMQQVDESSPAASDIPESYIVQKGDTLLGISRKIYGRDDKIDEICSLNDIVDSDRILAGQKLLLP